MTNSNKILLGVIIVLLLVLSVLIFLQNIKIEKSYYGVYLNTGDLYFGELETFPKLALTNIYFLQREGDNTGKSYFSLAKFNEASWGPEDKMYLNEKNIIWVSKLSVNSEVLKSIKNPELLKNAQNPQGQPSQSELEKFGASIGTENTPATSTEAQPITKTKK